MDIPGDEDGKQIVLGVDTKLRHKGSQILYTVAEVGPEDIVLMTPEGKPFVIDASTVEQEYELG